MPGYRLGYLHAAWRTGFIDQRDGRRGHEARTPRSPCLARWASVRSRVSRAMAGYEFPPGRSIRIGERLACRCLTGDRDARPDHGRVILARRAQHAGGGGGEVVRPAFAMEHPPKAYGVDHADMAASRAGEAQGPPVQGALLERAQSSPHMVVVRSGRSCTSRTSGGSDPASVHRISSATP